MISFTRPKPALPLDDELADLVDRLAVAQTRDPATREAHRHCAGSSHLHRCRTGIAQPGTGTNRRVASNRMCGRFVSASPPDQIAAYFSADRVARAGARAELERRADRATCTWSCQDGGVRRVTTRHWGLVPFWAKDAKVGNRMINARAETVATSGAFKRAFAKRRCLVPADGFYEWQRVPGQKNKQPYFIHRPDGEPFAFAGLWEVWRPKDDEGADEEGAEPLRSTTIITTSANEEMARIHDRMPVILPPSAWDAWLDPGQRRPRDARQAAGARAAGADHPPAGEHRREQRPQPGPAPDRRGARTRPARRCSTAPSHGRPARRDPLDPTSMSRPGRPGFRRRLDTLALRAQARLDADWADHIAAVAHGRGAVRGAVRDVARGGPPARRRARAWPSGRRPPGTCARATRRSAASPARTWSRSSGRSSPCRCSVAQPLDPDLAAARRRPGARARARGGPAVAAGPRRSSTSASAPPPP